MIKRLLLLVSFSWLGLTVFAQADVDSPYSMFGVGQVSDKSKNVGLMGMGSVANAMFGGGVINSENPASYAKIDSLAFLFDAGLYFKTSTFSTSGLSEKSNNASFDHVAMAFGLLPWWKMALGVQPYSTSGYTMVVNGNRPDLGNYSTRFKGSGGLNQAFWGNAFKLSKHLSIGSNIYYVFGDTQNETTVYFPDSLYYMGSRRSIDLMVSSFMFDYGLLYDVGIGDDMRLGIGLTYNQSVRLRGKQSLFIRSIEEDPTTTVEYLIDTIVDTTYSSWMKMPQGFGVGVVLQKNNRWRIGADFNWMQWSKFARQGVSDSLQNSWNVLVGAEFSPRHSSISNYFTKVSYRIGGIYEHGYLSINGHSINKFGVTAGMSLPLPKTLSKVNLAVEIGQYGTHYDGLIRERYVKVDLGISVFEHWFIKRTYR